VSGPAPFAGAKSTASILPIRLTPSIRAPASESRLGSKVFSVATPAASADSTSAPSSPLLSLRAVISTSGNSGMKQRVGPR